MRFETYIEPVAIRITANRELRFRLQFLNAVVLNAVGRRSTQMRAKEHKRESAKERKRARARKKAQTQVRKREQKSAKECFRVKIANDQV